MPVFISLLRGINVGGNKRIKMADLRALYESLGFVGTQSILQTGNVVFETKLEDRDQLAQQIENGIEQRFGFHSDIIIRTVDEFRGVADKNPFLTRSAFEPGKLLVMFLRAFPDAEAIDDLITTHTGPELIHPDGQTLYLYYPDGMGRSKLSNVLIEKKLKISGTGRNWNTVTKLSALAEGFEAR